MGLSGIPRAIDGVMLGCGVCILGWGVYETASRKLGRGAIGLIAMTLTLVVTIVALIAMGRLCITSPRRLVDRYEGNLALDGGGAAVDSRADGAVGAKGTRASRRHP